MALNASVNVQLGGNHTSVLDFNTGDFSLAKKFLTSFANGTGLNQANKIFTDTRAVTTGATDALDLSGGGLLDAFGVVLVYTALKGLIIRSAAANTTNLTVLGNAAAVPILGTVATTMVLKPGGVFVWLDTSAAGTTVTAATGDIIQIVNAAGATANYDVVLLGI